jgi:16S rRNA (guanine(966)-N(2))-methyltransferase RsmD
MRVISGSAKGIQLDSVPGKSTRPITDRVKEALFNILSESVYDTTWLDLFGGTGAVGIEALSRGAEHVLFIELNFKAYKVILGNLKTTKLAEFATVKKMDAFTLLHSDPDSPYDVIYVAPPQYQEIWIKAMQALDEKPGWLAENGQIIIQIHPKEWQDGIAYANFTEFDRRQYGDTLLIFYEHTLSE